MNKNSVFKPLESREPINKLIAQQIEQAILEKRYQPGSKLPSENELCDQFGVSRTSVREALTTLEAQGLIDIVKGKGMFVRQISSETVVAPLQNYLKLSFDRSYVLDLVHARQIIEPAIASYAALNYKERDLMLLQKNIKELKSCEGGYLELANLDASFHMLLAHSSQNVIVPLLLAPIHRLMPELKSSVYKTVGDAKESAIVWHQKILDAVITRDAKAAESAMSEHLKIAEQHTVQMLQSIKTD